jgi:transposase-like protein
MKLSNPVFHDEAAARKHLEALRWPDGVVCPFCGTKEAVKALGGKSMGEGWYHCGSCRDKFTVRVGTLFERSKIPLHKWLLAFRLMASSKKGFSAHQLHRTLEITYKSAWFMAMRIREAMREGADFGPMGSGGGYVEVDETYIGKNGRIAKGGGGWRHKNAVLSLVERDGKVRSHHVQNVKAETLKPILLKQISESATLMTDEASMYKKVGQEFKAHNIVRHSLKEYVRGNDHTNTVEGYFSIFKRGMTGVYQHCSEQHLKRYVSEFDFRYNNRKVSDGERADIALKGIEGKRLTYQGTRPAKETEISV